MKKLILIRHGITEANEKRQYCGWTDIGLSEKGIEDLKSQRLSNVYPDINGYSVYTSGMKRTEETLSILYGNVEHTAVEALKEVNFGKFELHTYDELKLDQEYIDWITGENEKNVPPDGESGEMMRLRALPALDAIINSNDYAAVFTHGGIIASIMDYLFHDEGKNRYEWQPKGGQGYEISFVENRAITWTKVPLE